LLLVLVNRDKLFSTEHLTSLHYTFITQAETKWRHSKGSAYSMLLTSLLSPLSLVTLVRHVSSV
jgi:hypothetical protein